MIGVRFEERYTLINYQVVLRTPRFVHLAGLTCMASNVTPIGPPFRDYDGETGAPPPRVVIRRRATVGWEAGGVDFVLIMGDVDARHGRGAVLVEPGKCWWGRGVGVILL